jgi:hypothetical protein
MQRDISVKKRDAKISMITDKIQFELPQPLGFIITVYQI